MSLRTAGDFRDTSNQNLNSKNGLVGHELVHHPLSRVRRFPHTTSGRRTRDRQELAEQFGRELRDCADRSCLLSTVRPAEAAGVMADLGRCQRNEVEADVRRFTEVRPDVADGVRQSLQWIVRPDRQGPQGNVRRGRQYQFGARHVQMRRFRFMVHGGFSSHELLVRNSQHQTWGRSHDFHAAKSSG
ncbi:hypothetical protein [Amycolatopsis sp. SID8362]|uniref:hypothetical protein n=1 Tax=Amycolatopsis sp. SID8362 TaxID=2690346 RepID=UPI0013D4EDB4|nr:hypothetical protein [Amycolatopsis sp. SID8362]NED42727.1 hypothetical protein [Amycolatopsis sp. SID8362]